MIIKAIGEAHAIEYDIQVNGFPFLCIFGTHTNGGFISIVNWGVSAEISAWKNKSNFLYNTNRIFEAFERSKDGELLSDDKNVRFQIAREIAVAIENIDGWSYNDYYERKN